MGVFLDTSFILATRYHDDQHHKIAQNLMQRYLRGEFGRIYLSTFVFDELMTIILTKLKQPHVAITIGQDLINSSRITLLHLTKQNFWDTWQLFQKYQKRGLSFTDASILSMCAALNCNYVATFDSHFKGLIGTNLTAT